MEAAVLTAGAAQAVSPSASAVASVRTRRNKSCYLHPGNFNFGGFLKFIAEINISDSHFSACIFKRHSFIFRAG